MGEETNSTAEHALHILERIERDPDTTQADLASHLGVAVGSVNWYLKHLIAKGHVKVTHLQRRRLRYLITPQGIAEKTRLTLSFMEVSLRTYREIRQEARQLLAQVHTRGYSRVRLEGDGDVGEIVRLTCLELGVQVQDSQAGLPAVVVNGRMLSVKWPPAPGAANPDSPFGA
jgi:DNA-binding MarR family transcriptional regulator